MKNITLTLTFLAALASAPLLAAAPLGAAFTYQGRLDDGGQHANNLYDLTFTLHDDPVNVASVGTYIILSAVPITNGLFTVQLNTNGEFGANAFNGQARWLLRIRCARAERRPVRAQMVHHRQRRRHQQRRAILC